MLWGKARWIVFMIAYHLCCASLLKAFKHDRDDHVLHRWLNELPVLILVGAAVLVVLKTF